MATNEVSAATSPGWTWDPSLYAGSARFYPIGRVGYPAEVAGALVGALDLDGTGRVLDVGYGPGSLTLLLAPHVGEAIGIDADADMLVEAARLASERGVCNARWRQLRAEELPADVPPVRVVTLRAVLPLARSAPGCRRPAACWSPLRDTGHYRRP